jgi:hypothetical protein
MAEGLMLTPSITQLSQVITQVTAPTFLLGAVAAFVSVLPSRMNRIIDRSQALNAISDNDQTKARLKSDIPRLKRRDEQQCPTCGGSGFVSDDDNDEEVTPTAGWFRFES